MDLDSGLGDSDLRRKNVTSCLFSSAFLCIRRATAAHVSFGTQSAVQPQLHAATQPPMPSPQICKLTLDLTCEMPSSFFWYVSETLSQWGWEFLHCGQKLVSWFLSFPWGVFWWFRETDRRKNREVSGHSCHRRIKHIYKDTTRYWNCICGGRRCSVKPRKNKARARLSGIFFAAVFLRAYSVYPENKHGIFFFPTELSSPGPASSQKPYWTGPSVPSSIITPAGWHIRSEPSRNIQTTVGARQTAAQPARCSGEGFPS